MFRTWDKLKTAAIKSRSNILMEVYKQVSKRTNAMNSKFKQECSRDKIHCCEGNMKDTLSTINMLINKRLKTTMISSPLIDGNVVTKPEKIADSMNRYSAVVEKSLAKTFLTN